MNHFAPRRIGGVLAGVLATGIGLALVTSAAPASARPASSGFYAEGGFGAAGYLGTASPYSKVGPSMSVRLGYDLFSWFSVGIQMAASSHEATVPAPPVGEWYQLYRGFAEGRLNARLDRLSLFLEGGAGAAYISSNVLAKVDILEAGESLTLALTGGAGLEYQLQNRHYGFGLAGDWMMLPGFDGEQAVEGRLYLRYTY